MSDVQTLLNAIRAKQADVKKDLDAATKERLRAAAHEESVTSAMKKLEEQAKLARDTALLTVLTPEVIDALAPEHRTPKCENDADPNYCARCALTAAHRDGWIDAQWRFTVGPEPF